MTLPTKPTGGTPNTYLCKLETDGPKRSECSLKLWASQANTNSLFKVWLISNSTMISSIWGFLRPRRGKLTFQPVGEFAPHRFQGQFGQPGPPGPPKIGDVKIDFDSSDKPNKWLIRAFHFLVSPGLITTRLTP